jgi:NTE family protein
MRKLKVGLALGGGGARGFAHLGILKVFQQHKIPIDIIAGTSMGAMIGGLYALNPDIDFLENKIQTNLKSDLFGELSSNLLKQDEKIQIRPFHRFISYIKQLYLYYNLYKKKDSLLEEKQIEKILEVLFSEKNIEDAKIPFVCVAADLCTGEEITPVDAAFKLGADIVIAVDVRSKLRHISSIDNGLAIIFRANKISGIKLSDLQLKKANFVLSPRIKNISWMSFKKANFCVQQGENEATLKIEEIKSLISKMRKKTFLKRLLVGDRNNKAQS